MIDLDSTLETAALSVVHKVQERMSSTGKSPFLLAIDGGSGAGKSTLSALIAQKTGAALIQSDDFFAAEISDAEWDARTPPEKALDVINWRRLRSDVLEPLLARQTARWQPFDFERKRPDGTYPLRADFAEREPAEVIVLDGAYATRPELGDLIDLTVLVDVPVSVRHARLAHRESADFLSGWHARWDAAEQYYFAVVRPPSSFDLVITTNS